MTTHWENPMVIFSTKAWNAYIARRAEFKVGQYVFVDDDKVVHVSEEPNFDYKSPNHGSLFRFTVADDDIEDYKLQTSNFNTTTELPANLQAQFLELLKVAENQTGKKFELSLHQFGCASNKGLKIGNFEDRKNYRVYKAQSKYKMLEGTFVTYDELKQHVEKFRFRFALATKVVELDGNKYTVWQCPACKEWGSKGSVNNFYSVCKNCHKSFYDSGCEHLSIDLGSGYIYTSNGVSLSICTTIAYVTFE